MSSEEAINIESYQEVSEPSQQQLFEVGPKQYDFTNAIISNDTITGSFGIAKLYPERSTQIFTIKKTQEKHQFRINNSFHRIIVVKSINRKNKVKEDNEIQENNEIQDRRQVMRSNGVQLELQNSERQQSQIQFNSSVQQSEEQEQKKWRQRNRNHIKKPMRKKSQHSKLTLKRQLRSLTRKQKELSF